MRTPKAKTKNSRTRIGVPTQTMSSPPSPSTSRSSSREPTLGYDGLPRRVVPGRKLSSHPKAATVVSGERELVVVLQGCFEVSESEAMGFATMKTDHVLGANHGVPRNLYTRKPSASSSSTSSFMTSTHSYIDKHRDSYPLSALVQRTSTVETDTTSAFGISVAGLRNKVR